MKIKAIAAAVNRPASPLPQIGLCNTRAGIPYRDPSLSSNKEQILKRREYDFKNRGEGDLFGVKQSGQALFKLADIKKDFELLVRVKDDVDYFFESNFQEDKIHLFKDYLIEDNLLN